MTAYEIVPFERGNDETRTFVKELLLLSYDDPYAAKEFPWRRAEHGLFNCAHFEGDLSAIIRQAGRNIGAVVLTRPVESSAWELGLFHILPEFQRRGIGSSVLEEIEEKVAESGFPRISMRFHSPRSLVNGIPAFRQDVLDFFTKRGYRMRDNVAGAYVNTPARFNSHCDKDKLAHVIKAGKDEGFRALNVRREDNDYENIRYKAVELCSREKHENWKRFLELAYTEEERTGISIIEKEGKAAAVAAYSFLPAPPTVWGYVPQWGPLLTDSNHRKKGLAAWVIANSLSAQFENGAGETMLWTEVGGHPSKIYESFGFRLLCPWYAIEKEL